MSEYSRKHDGETEYMFLLIIEDDKQLEKCNKIWNEVSKRINKEIHSDQVYNEKSLRIKIKSYESKINPHFHNNKVQKKVVICIYLSVISIDSVLKRGTNCYLFQKNIDTMSKKKDKKTY